MLKICEDPSRENGARFMTIQIISKFNDPFGRGRPRNSARMQPRLGSSQQFMIALPTTTADYVTQSFRAAAAPLIRSQSP